MSALACYEQAEHLYALDLGAAQRCAWDAAQSATRERDALTAVRAWALWALLGARRNDVPLDIAQAQWQQAEAAMAQWPPDSRARDLLCDVKAFLVHREGDDARALRLAMPQFESPSATRSPLERAFNLRVLSLTTLALGDFAQSLRFRHLALTEAQASGDKVSIARALHTIGHWHETQFNLDDAIKALRESHRIWCGVWPAGRLRALSTVTLLHVLGLAEHHDEAHTLLRRWLDQPGGVAQDGDRLEDWSAEVAQALINVGRLSEAKPYLDMGGAATFFNPRRPALWTRAKACWLLAMGRPAEARALAQGFLDEAERGQKVLEPLTQMQMYELVGRASDAAADPEGSAKAARQSCAMLVPLVGQSAKAQYFTLKVLTDPQARQLISGTDEARLAAIDESLAAFRLDAPATGPKPNVAERRWLARVTHDLRSPLNGVLGLTSMLLMTKLDQQQRHLATLAERSAHQLLHLVNDILDLARADAGRLRIAPRQFEIRPLLHELVEVHRLQATRGVDVRLEWTPGLAAMAWADPSRLLQVLGNLLSNAIKATTKGSVVLRVAPRPGNEAVWRFEVQDSGPGIAPALQRQLFHEEFAGDGTGGHVDAPHQGTGLGLALVRHLVTLMGGEVGLASKLGEGSRLWADLPMAPAAAQPQRARPALDAGSR